MDGEKYTKNTQHQKSTAIVAFRLPSRMFIKCLVLKTVLYCVCVVDTHAWVWLKWNQNDVNVIEQLFRLSFLSQRPYDIKLTNLSFYSTSNIIWTNITMKDSVVDTLVDLKSTFQQMYLHMSIDVDLGNGKFDFNAMNRTIDVCRVYRDRKYEPFIQILYKSVLPSCNCPSRCPIGKVKIFKFLMHEPAFELNFRFLEIVLH